jgi:hypothetical protein
MWGQIAQAIAKVYGENEETKRNAVDKVEQTAKAGDGNNGVDYSNIDAGSEGGGVASVGSGYQKPDEQDTSATNATTKAVGSLASVGKDALSSLRNKEPEGDDDKKEAAQGTMSNMGDMGGSTPTSDERLKRIFGDDEDAIKCFAKIDAIKFEYNDKAKEIHPNGEHQVDDDPHYGVKAQDLLKNPLTASTVEKDESGYLAVNTPELTMANSAVISEICKRLEIIEKVLGIKVKE